MVTSCAAGQCTARCLASSAPACMSLGVASAPKRQWKAACSVPGKRPAAATERPSVCAALTRTPVLAAVRSPPPAAAPSTRLVSTSSVSPRSTCADAVHTRCRCGADAMPMHVHVCVCM